VRQAIAEIEEVDERPRTFLERCADPFRERVVALIERPELGHEKSL
jgi:hypothetical protein